MNRFTLFLVVFFASCSSHPPHAEREIKSPSPVSLQMPVADAHFHFLDFLQETDGIEAALRAMDQAGVDHAMISGMPVVKKWDKEDARRPLYYLDNDSRVYWYSATDVAVAQAVLSLPAASQARFHPFITGFNPTDRNAVDHVQRLMSWYPHFWEGIGEIMGRHDDLSALTYGETARPNSPALDPLYRWAAEHDMPVSIHSNIGSVGLREPIYLHEIEEMLNHHPKTRFIWCHAGVSRRIEIPTLVDHLRRTLRQHPNLWIDLSWIVYENVVAPQGVVSTAWVTLIREFPDRFMIGSDKVGRFAKLTQEIRKYDPLLAALPESIARRVAHDNFLSILPKEAQQKAKKLKF